MSSCYLVLTFQSGHPWWCPLSTLFPRDNPGWGQRPSRFRSLHSKYSQSYPDLGAAHAGSYTHHTIYIAVTFLQITHKWRPIVGPVREMYVLYFEDSKYGHGFNFPVCEYISDFLTYFKSAVMCYVYVIWFSWQHTDTSIGAVIVDSLAVVNLALGHLPIDTYQVCFNVMYSV